MERDLERPAPDHHPQQPGDKCHGPRGKQSGFSRHVGGTMRPQVEEVNDQGYGKRPDRARMGSNAEPQGKGQYGPGKRAVEQPYDLIAAQGSSEDTGRK